MASLAQQLLGARLLLHERATATLILQYHILILGLLETRASLLEHILMVEARWAPVGTVMKFHFHRRSALLQVCRRSPRDGLGGC